MGSEVGGVKGTPRSSSSHQKLGQGLSAASPLEFSNSPPCQHLCIRLLASRRKATPLAIIHDGGPRKLIQLERLPGSDK